MKASSYCLLLLLFSSCTKESWQSPSVKCSFNEEMNPNHSKASDLEQLMNHYTSLGLPGISMAVSSPEGLWAGAAGYSKIEDKSPMQPCHLQYGQSVAKTYMAVAILKMADAGMLQLDQGIDEVLPQSVSEMITDASSISVRMLLNHTSGIDEYNDKASYVSYLLQHPLHEFSPMDYLGYIDGRPLDFTPGTDYRYSNTNYILLAMIGDFLTGDHAAYIRSELLEAAGLLNTFYHEDGFLEKEELVNTYWDRYSNGSLENCSKMHKTNVKTLIGDDGVVATPFDFVLFSKALHEGEFLSESMMKEMLSFRSSTEYSYALGIHRDFYKENAELGHTGGGIGAGCYLAYFPSNDTHVFIAVNIGTSIYSPIFEELDQLSNDVFDIILAE